VCHNSKPTKYLSSPGQGCGVADHRGVRSVQDSYEDASTSRDLCVPYTSTEAESRTSSWNDRDHLLFSLYPFPSGSTISRRVRYH